MLALNCLYGHWVKLPSYLCTRRHSDLKKIKSYNDRRILFCTSLSVTSPVAGSGGLSDAYLSPYCGSQLLTVCCGRHCWWCYRWKWTTGWQRCKRFEIRIWGVLRKGHDGNYSERLGFVSSFEYSWRCCEFNLWICLLRCDLQMIIEIEFDYDSYSSSGCYSAWCSCWCMWSNWFAAVCMEGFNVMLLMSLHIHCFISASLQFLSLSLSLIHSLTLTHTLIHSFTHSLLTYSTTRPLLAMDVSGCTSGLSAWEAVHLTHLLTHSMHCNVR